MARTRVLPDLHADSGSSIIQTIVALASVAVVLKGLDSLGVITLMSVDTLFRLVSRSAGHAEGQVSHLVGTATSGWTVTVLVFVAVAASLVTVMLVSSSRAKRPQHQEHAQLHARKGALVGFNTMVKFLQTLEALPGGGIGPLENVDAAASTVSYRGRPVTLSASQERPANYPVTGIQSEFERMGQGQLNVDGSPVAFSTAATLLSIRLEKSFDSPTPLLVQSWRLMARGAVLGSGQPSVEVSTEFGRQIIPAFKYGLFATKDSCGALEFEGGVRVNSYDSSNATRVSGLPKSDDWGGHIGTNGNLAARGGSMVFGSLSTPRRGVGACQEGPVKGADPERPNPVAGTLIELPDLLLLEPPTAPSPLPPATAVVITPTTTQADVPLKSGVCQVAYPRPGQAVVTLDPQGKPMTLGNVHVTAGAALVLQAGTYHLNSLTLSGQGILQIGSGPVILHVAGSSQATPINFEAGTVLTESFDASNFRILYAGSGRLHLSGGSTLVASVYAPDAEVRITGGADCFGGVVAARISITGGGSFHYDRHLHECVLVGPTAMSALTWREY